MAEQIVAQYSEETEVLPAQELIKVKAIQNFSDYVLPGGYTSARFSITNNGELPETITVRLVFDSQPKAPGQDRCAWVGWFVVKDLNSTQTQIDLTEKIREKNVTTFIVDAKHTVEARLTLTFHSNCLPGKVQVRVLFSHP
jgi:hypothetical protein